MPPKLRLFRVLKGFKGPEKSGRRSEGLIPETRVAAQSVIMMEI